MVCYWLRSNFCGSWYFISLSNVCTYIVISTHSIIPRNNIQGYIEIKSGVPLRNEMATGVPTF